MKNDNKKITEAYKNRNKPRARKINKNGKPLGTKQGYYIPVNPSKYGGDATSIIYRSSWERQFCTYCDKSANVIMWASEPFFITYFNPITKKPAKYYIDFVMQLRKFDRNNEAYTESILVEVKPKGKLKKPIFKGNKTVKKLKNYERDVKEYLVNEAKFISARKYANDFGHKFLIVTEDFF